MTLYVHLKQRTVYTPPVSRSRRRMSIFRRIRTRRETLVIKTVPGIGFDRSSPVRRHLGYLFLYCCPYRKRDSTQYSRRRSGSGGGGGGGDTIERKSSYEAVKRIEYGTSCATLRMRDDSGDTCASVGGGGGGGKSIDYDVCPYATFSVVQTTTAAAPSVGRMTPAHHRALGQTDCYETPDCNIRGLIDNSYGQYANTVIISYERVRSERSFRDFSFFSNLNYTSSETSTFKTLYSQENETTRRVFRFYKVL